MFDWTLKIEVDGQWESCRYSTQSLAQNAYEAVLKDYGKRISQAQLVSKDGTVRLLKILSKLTPSGPSAGPEKFLIGRALPF